MSISTRLAFLVFVIATLAFGANAAVTRASHSQTVVALSRSELVADAVATAAVAIAQRAGVAITESVDDEADVDTSALSGPPDADATLMQISQAMYNINLKAGDKPNFSFAGKCQSSTVLASVSANNFVSWVLHVPALNAVVVAFRGTVNTDNIASDLDFKKDACKLGSLSCGSAHGGFYKLYSDSRARILSAVVGFLNKNPSVTTVYAVGHSLGAAVAVIAGLDLANLYAARSSIKIKVVGWGVPRVGDKTFASKFGSFPSLSVTRYRQWRKILLVAKEWDPVSLIPLEMQGFEHVGTEVAIECKTCSSWVAVHRMQNYIASFARLGRALASC